MGYKFENIEHPYFKEILETELKDRYQQYLKHALDKLSQDENIGKCKDGRIAKYHRNTKERFIKILKERNEGLTLKEIGKILNLSTERIRQIEKKALKKIRLPSFYKPILDELLLGEYKKIEDNLLSNKYDDGIGLVYRQLKRELNITVERLNTLEDKIERFENQIQTEEINKKEVLLKILSKPIGTLEISTRSANCMKFCNVHYVSDLVQKTEAELLEKKNFGRKSLWEIKELLAEMGLSLGMKVKERYIIDDVLPNESIQEFLDKKIDEIELPFNIINIIKKNSITKIGYLVGIKESDVYWLSKYDLKTKHQESIGREGVDKIKEVLSKHGLSLGMKIHRSPT